MSARSTRSLCAHPSPGLPARHRLRPLILAFSLLLPASVWSVDLKQAFDSALDGDARIRAARATVEATAERLPQAQSQLLPQITASTGRNRNAQDTISNNLLGDPKTTRYYYDSYARNVSFRMALLRHQQWVGLEQARKIIDDSLAIFDATVQELSARVGQAYFEVLLAQEQLEMVKSEKKSTTAQLDAARKALIAGSGMRTDVDEARARLDLTLARELEAAQSVNFTRSQLQVLINQPIGTVTPLDAAFLSRSPQKVDSLETWVERATASSPEIRSLAARAEASRLEVSKAAAAHYPTVDMVAQWSNSLNDQVTNLNSAYKVASVGFQLNLPLYSGGYMSSVERQASAQYVNARELHEAGLRDLGLRVQKEYRGVTEGLLRIHALEQAVRSAKVALDSASKSYAAGSRTLLNVLDAENALSIAEQNLAQARYAYLAARLRLGALAGEGPVTIDLLNGWLAVVQR